MFAVDSSGSELFFTEKFIFVPTNTNNYVNQIFLENLLGQAHFFSLAYSKLKEGWLSLFRRAMLSDWNFEIVSTVYHLSFRF